MSLIEQAAKRLEELRRAGVDVSRQRSATQHGAPDHVPERMPTPEAAVAHARAEARTETRHPPGEGHRERRVETPQVEINLHRLRTAGFITPDAPRSQIADEFRVIKRPIIRNAKKVSGAKLRNGNLVMVTSALPGEGKTFTATNLAMSLAMELDTTVLLVDGDVLHPSLPGLLDLPSSPGLLDVLTREDLDVSEAILRTNVPNLSILSGGTQQPRATELLASERMALLQSDLSSRYPDRIIVFDSPPLLATTEARVLATHMGQIVMVVAADSTRQSTVTHALSTIETCEVVLTVLNKADKPDVGTFYEYYSDHRPS